MLGISISFLWRWRYFSFYDGKFVIIRKLMLLHLCNDFTFNFFGLLMLIHLCKYAAKYFLLHLSSFLSWTCLSFIQELPEHEQQLLAVSFLEVYQTFYYIFVHLR